MTHVSATMSSASLLRVSFISLEIQMIKAIKGAALACVALSTFALAQGYPARPVRVLVPYAPAGPGALDLVYIDADFACEATHKRRAANAFAVRGKALFLFFLRRSFLRRPSTRHRLLL